MIQGKYQRIEGKEAQPDSGPGIARFVGVERPVGGGPSTDVFNKRQKWNGTQWVYDDGPTPESSVELYSENVEVNLGIGQLVTAVWRSPAKRWETIATASIFIARVTTAITAAVYTEASPPNKAKITPGTGEGSLYYWDGSDYVDTEETVTIKTIANSPTAVGKHVAGTYDAGTRILTVEPCDGMYS